MTFGNSQNRVIFRRNVTIGAADAESDDLFLSECFIDTGDMAALLDCNNPKSIALGRTGSGKTALIREILKRGENVIELAPETLALSYITNSNVIKFFEAAGVSLDPFFTLLWRHIIAVELLRKKFEIYNENKQSEFLTYIRGYFNADANKKGALQYLEDWGSKFWKETEYRTREFTTKLETELQGSAKIDVHAVHLGAQGVRKLSEEQKTEVAARGQEVVNAVQIKKLHEVIQFLSEDVFNDAQRRYYIVIDRLDEDWVDDSIRFKLIRALIEAIRSFRKVRSVKIIVALRTDLHYRVFKETADAGFQEEKYEALYLKLRWTRQQLEKLLDKRVSLLFRRQYTNSGVTLRDVLPTNQIEKRDAIVYILDRTFFRPREAIIFLNECIARAEGAAKITVQNLRKAEVSYSQKRLLSLAQEWKREYPRLVEYADILRRRETPFTVDAITLEEVEAFAVAFLTNEAHRETDPVYRLTEDYYLSSRITQDVFLERLMGILYHVGLIGVKPEPHLGRQWSHMDEPSLMPGQLKPTSPVDVHKTFKAALGVTRRSGTPAEDVDDE